MLTLASSSPRRRELLRLLVPHFQVRPAAVDESKVRGEAPAEYVIRVARIKAEAVAAQAQDGFVLGADTAVVLDGKCLGKPSGGDEARQMLLELAGRTHQVLSAVVLIGEDGRATQACSESRVTFAPLNAGWIDRYVAFGEPMDKAGAYAIQGQAGTRISRLEGSFTGVVGLPLPETAKLLRNAGIAT